ncbi:MAG: hypothetical protein HQL98_09440 [Magnetococcales bacterium]|nr:hypothetical protein [Magnetococcales bacterium]
MTRMTLFLSRHAIARSRAMPTYPWIYLLVALLFLMPVMAQAGQSDLDFALQGPSFEPGKPNPKLVTPEWIQKGITHPTGGEPFDLQIEMDQNLYEALTPLVEQYAAGRGLKVRINRGTCGTSSGPLAKKEADMAGFCCPPASYDRLPGIVFHTIGIVPTVFITHPGNPVTRITFGEVQKIYSGDLREWRELSDPAAREMTGTIQPVARLHCETRPGHWREILDNKSLFFQYALFVSSIPDMVDTVASNPNAFGWISRWVVEKPTNKGRVRWLKLNGVDPDDTQAVSEGKYPYFKVMNMTTWEGAGASPLADRLIDHLLNRSDPAQNAAFIVPASALRRHGWRFDGNELIGTPNHQTSP